MLFLSKCTLFQNIEIRGVLQKYLNGFFFLVLVAFLDFFFFFLTSKF